MVIVWGQRMCGKVDQVGGLVYVHTRFFHVYYVPLIPLQSFIVVAGAESENGFQGVGIPMSGKSVLVGWLRTGLVLAILVGAIAGVVNLLEVLGGVKPGARHSLLVCLAVLASSVLSYWLSLRFMRPGYQRALLLGEHLGIPRHVIAGLYVASPGAEAEGAPGPADDAEALEKWNKDPSPSDNEPR